VSGALVLVSGELFREPQAKTSKNGKPYTVGTLRVGNGDSTAFWSLLAFGGAAEELARLSVKHPWFGRVWCNPPYGKFWAKFVARCVQEFQAGRVEQAIILIQANHTPTGKFQDAMSGVEYLRFEPRNRINFNSNVFKVSTATQPSVLIAIGVPSARFQEAFSHLGKISFAGGDR
jgi:hypothetical protein